MKRLRCLFTLCLAAFLFPVFSYSQYLINGSAHQESCNCYSLTQNDPQQSGSVWQSVKINLENSFDFSFNVNLGCTDDGADGIAFILQPNSGSIGASGQGLGFEGIVPSIGITLDTYQNLSGDPAYDHISIQANGNIDHDLDLAGPAPASSVSDNIEDCNWHVLRIKWDAATHTLSTYFDGVFRLSTQTDLVTTVFNNDPLVYWGFSGATGVQYNLQKFCTPLVCNFKSNLSNDATCFGNPVVFEDNSISFTQIQSFYWDFGDGTSSTQASPPAHSYTQPGSYIVTHYITAADGCTSEQAIRTILIGDKPNVSFNIYDTCSAISPRIENKSTTKIGTVSQLAWQLDGNSLPNIEAQTLNNTTPGDHLLTLTATSSIGCVSAALTKTFNIKNKPEINMAAVNGCINTPIIFTAAQSDLLTIINSWSWNFGDGQSSAAENTNHSYDTKGLYPVTVTATATNGCRGTASKEIFINQANAVAGKDTVIIVNTPFQLHGTGGDFYTWTPSVGLNNSKISDPVGNAGNDIRYLLTVRTNEGCVDTAGIKITVFKGSAIYVPTGFTPNNDGRNDVMRPAYIAIKSLSYFTIYNRWGQEVFSTNSMNASWNGNCNGQNLDTGSFVWVLKATDLIGKIYSLKGSFTLIR
ncbi:MAG: PKD domain-containing protein [Ginsengibacter sp.]